MPHPPCREEAQIEIKLQTNNYTGMFMMSL